MINEILEELRIRLATYPYFMSEHPYNLALAWSIGRNGTGVLETYRFCITKENQNLYMVCTTTNVSCSLQNNKNLADQLRLITASMNVAGFPLNQFLDNICDSLERTLASEPRLHPSTKFVKDTMISHFSSSELIQVTSQLDLDGDSIGVKTIEEQALFVTKYFNRRSNQEKGMLYLLLKRAKPFVQWMGFVAPTHKLPDRNTLVRYMKRGFGTDDLESMCYFLDVEVEELNRGKKSKLVDAIVQHMEKNGRLVELAVHVRRLRSEAP